MNGAHWGKSILTAAVPCLFPGLRERECVGVLPVIRLMREGGERKREGHCQMQGGRRQEGGGRKILARIQSGCVFRGNA